MNDENGVIVSYVVEKALEDIRQGKEISDNLACALNTPKYLDPMRAALNKSDSELLLTMAQGKTNKPGILALSLLNRSCVSSDPRVKPMLVKVWNESADCYRRQVAMMVLLEDQDMANKMNSEFYRFVKDNFDTFKKNFTLYATKGGGESMLSFCQRRLNDPDYPRCKKWTYLCALLASEDTAAIKEILQSYARNDEYAFNKQVALDMLTILPQKTLA